MRNVLYLISLLYIAIVFNMIDNRLDSLSDVVAEKNNKVVKGYKLPNDVKQQFDKVIKRRHIKR